MEHDAAQIESTTTSAPVLDGRALAAPMGGGGGGRSARLARVQRTAGNRIAAASVRRRTDPGTPGSPADADRTQVGLEGGPVGADFEQGLQSARSGGRPIEDSVRRSLEGTIGADLSDVRLHSGSQSAELNEQISAKAFTVGSDIFFREGVPDTSTTDGQHLLAHEVAHTVQQTGGAQRRVIRRDLTAPKNPDVDPSTLRDASTKTAAGTKTNVSTKAPKASVAGDVAGAVTSTMDGMAGAAIVSSENQYHSDMEKAGSGPAGVMPGADKAGSIDVSAGAGESVLALFNVYKAYKALTDDSNDEKLMASLELAQSVTSVGAGIAKVTDKGSSVESGGESVGKASEAASGLAGITDSFGAVKAAFSAASTLIELLRHSEEYSTIEQRRMAFDALRNATEAARSSVSAARGFLDMAGSSVTAAMVQTVPGLGLALTAADVAVRLYDLAVARVQAGNMKTRAETLQSELRTLENGPQPHTKEVTERIAKMRQEVATATSLEYINDKRQDRSYLKLAVAATRIAGDIATLGGASAPVGIGIKVAALAIDVGASIFRKAKQWFRDKVADPVAANELPSKGAKLTTAGKHAEYNRMITNVLDIVKEVFSGVGATEPLDPTKTAATDPKYDTGLLPVATDYLAAVGYTVEQMARDIAKDSTGAEVRKSMFAALQRRE